MRKLAKWTPTSKRFSDHRKHRFYWGFSSCNFFRPHLHPSEAPHPAHLSQYPHRSTEYLTHSGEAAKPCHVRTCTAESAFSYVFSPFSSQDCPLSETCAPPFFTVTPVRLRRLPNSRGDTPQAGQETPRHRKPLPSKVLHHLHHAAAVSKPAPLAPPRRPGAPADGPFVRRLAPVHSSR